MLVGHHGTMRSIIVMDQMSYLMLSLHLRDSSHSFLCHVCPMYASGGLCDSFSKEHMITVHLLHVSVDVFIIHFRQNTYRILCIVNHMWCLYYSFYRERLSSRVHLVVSGWLSDVYRDHITPLVHLIVCDRLSMWCLYHSY